MDAIPGPDGVIRLGEIILDYGRVIRGRLIPPPGIELGDGIVFGGGSIAIVSPDSGKFELIHLPQGDIEVVANVRGFATVRKVLSSDRPPLEIPLVVGHTVRGRVLDAQGRGVARALVAAGDIGCTQSDGDGHFVFEHLPPGPCPLFAQSFDARHQMTTYETKTVRVDAQKENSAVILRPARGGAEVRVKAGPQLGFTLLAAEEGRQRPMQAALEARCQRQVSSAGDFVFRHVPPGRYFLVHQLPPIPRQAVPFNIITVPKDGRLEVEPEPADHVQVPRDSDSRPHKPTW